MQISHWEMITQYLYETNDSYPNSIKSLKNPPNPQDIDQNGK